MLENLILGWAGVDETPWGVRKSLILMEPTSGLEPLTC